MNPLTKQQDRIEKIIEISNMSILFYPFSFNIFTLIKVYNVQKIYIYSHSIVPGGFEVISYVTLLIPSTSLIIRVAVSPKNSWLKG